MPTQNAAVSTRNLDRALKAVVKDNVVTADEVARLVPAAVRDLGAAGAAAAKGTPSKMAETLRAFIEPFRANDLQEVNGLRMDRSVRSSMVDLADTLVSAAEKLHEMKSGLFGAAMGISLDDGKLTAHEARALNAVAKNLLK